MSTRTRHQNPVLELMTHPPQHIAVFGANGAIGSAFTRQMRQRYPDAIIHAAARGRLDLAESRMRSHQVDPADEAALGATVRDMAADGPLDMVVVASGMLHGDGHMPEKALRDLTAESLHQLFHVNTAVPALILKHTTPFLRRDGRAVFAALSARVGSIGDNRLGGWYAYRASKAALNMILRTAAIEIARRNGQSVIVGLHPGTVESALSAPFRRSVPDGKMFDAEFSAARMLDVLEGLDPSHSGGLFAWDGAKIAY